MKSLYIIFLAAIFLPFSTVHAGGWKSDTEAGMVVQNGNSKSNNVYTKTNLGKTAGKNTYTLIGEYISNEADGVRTSEYSKAGARYDRSLNEKTSLFLAPFWEKDNFAGYEDRYASDLGAKYLVVKSDKFSLTTEFGYRYRNEYAYIRGDGRGESEDSNFGRVYFEASRKLTPTTSFKLWAEALYDFNEEENFESRFEPSIDIALGNIFGTKERPAQINLKIAYRGTFDNLPAVDTAKRFDSLFTTNLKILY